MSNMYNAVVGYDPMAPVVLGILKTVGLDQVNIPRFRDAYVIPAGERGQNSDKLVVLTRTGGGSRSEYVEANAEMAQIPGYVEDYDDDFDSTFAHFVYDVPEDMTEKLRTIIDYGRSVNGYDFPLPMERLKAAVGQP